MKMFATGTAEFGPTLQVFGVGYSVLVKVDGQVTLSMREKKE